MNLFKFRKYSYKQSYEGKTKQRIIDLTNKYENLFLKQIDGKLEKKEQEKYYKGINEVQKYVLNSIFFKINENYNSKTPIEKKAEAIYRRVSRYYDNLELELEEVIRDSIYEALGFGKNKKKVFKKENNTSYFIKYVINISFFNVLNYLEKKLNALDFEKENSIERTNDTDLHVEEEISEVDIDNLLQESGLKAALQDDLYKELKHCLLEKETPEKHLMPYLELLLNYKEQSENIHN